MEASSRSGSLTLRKGNGLEYGSWQVEEISRVQGQMATKGAAAKPVSMQHEGRRACDMGGKV